MSGGIERIGWAVRLEHPDGPRWHWDFWDEERAVMEAEAWAEDGYDAKAMPLYAAPEGTIESLEAERDELRAQNAALMDRICNCPHNARAEAAHHADWCDVCRALNPEEEG